MILSAKTIKLTLSKKANAILLAIAVCFLFCITASFAQPPQPDKDSDQSQRHIITKLRQINQLPYGNGFYCFGFSSAWLYSKWLQFVWPEQAIKYQGDWYKHSVIDILGNLSDLDNIKKFSSLVEKLHNSQCRGTFEQEMDKLGSGKKIHREYSIASLFTMKQFEQLLKEIVIYDHKLIMIISHDHATALFKDGENYYYFDPNYSRGELKLSSIDQVVDVFGQLANYAVDTFTPTKPLPLAIQIFSFDGVAPAIYPNQQTILEKLHPFLVCDSGYAFEMTGLHQAARIDCSESARYFLNKKVNIDLADSKGNTALIIAAMRANCQVVKLLLENKANTEVYNNNGATAFMFAAKYEDLDTMQLLIDYELANNRGLTELLVIAARQNYPKAAKLLLEHGANPNLADKNGDIALEVAATRDNVDIMRLLFEKGAKPDLADKYGRTAFNSAAINKCFSAMQLLLEKGAKPDLAKRDKAVLGLVRLVCEKGNYELMRLLLTNRFNPDSADDNGCTALMLAAYNNHFKIVQLLLEQGAAPNLIDDAGWTALRYAVRNGEKGCEIMELLLAYDANPNLPDKMHGITVLMATTKDNCLECVKILLKPRSTNFGIPINPELMDNNGKTALMYAKGKDRQEIAVELEEYTKRRAVLHKSKSNPCIKNTLIKNYQQTKLNALTVAQNNAIINYKRYEQFYTKESKPTAREQLKLRDLSIVCQTASNNLDAEEAAQENYQQSVNELRDNAVEKILNIAAQTGTLRIADITWKEVYDGKSESMSLLSSPNTEGSSSSIVKIIDWLKENKTVKDVDFSGADLRLICDELIPDLIDSRPDLVSIDLSECYLNEASLGQLHTVLKNKSTKIIFAGNAASKSMVNQFRTLDMFKTEKDAALGVLAVSESDWNSALLKHRADQRAMGAGW